MHVSVKLRVPCINFFFLLKWVNVNNNSESRIAKKKWLLKKKGRMPGPKFCTKNSQKKTPAFNFSD